MKSITGLSTTDCPNQLRIEGVVSAFEGSSLAFGGVFGGVLGDVPRGVLAIVFFVVCCLVCRENPGGFTSCDATGAIRQH